MDDDEDKHPRAEADELPVPRADLPPGPALLSRAAAAHGRVRLLPPLRAVGRAARHHAGARLHPGRRAHLLHRGADRRGNACASAICCRSIYRDFGFDGFPREILRPAGQRGPAATRSGTRPRRRCKEACATAGVDYTLNPGEGAFYGPKLEFVLRDAIGPRLAMRHAAGRFHPAGAAGRRLCRRGRQPPRPVMLHRAILGCLSASSAS